ncbi:MAG: hypothetical protein JW395_1501 [Nitrospira sp.]|nr:hypothetical protein [Nitrospira sp.]
MVSLLTVAALDQTEEHLIFAAVTDAAATLDEAMVRRLFSVPARAQQGILPLLPDALTVITDARRRAIQGEVSERNGAFFESEAAKLDGWAEDLKVGMEREIKELDRKIREARRGATSARTLEEKLTGQKQIKALEAQRNEKRRTLFDAQDDVDRRRGELIESIEAKLAQQVTCAPLFAARWHLE